LRPVQSGSSQWIDSTALDTLEVESEIILPRLVSPQGKRASVQRPMETLEQRRERDDRAKQRREKLERLKKSYERLKRQQMLDQSRLKLN
jgi:hypothetical protein